MLTDAELAAIRARADAAWPAPWFGELQEVFSALPGWNWLPNHDYGDAAKDADTAFIAHAREDVPRLLDEIERLKKDVGAYRELLRLAGIAVVANRTPT